jgi:hypothetical protein
VAQSHAAGAITFVEYSYALNAGFPVVKMLNAAGYYTEPTASNVAVALLSARINENESSPDYLTQDLSKVYTSADPRVYPLSSYSYIILPTKAESGFSEDRGLTLADFGAYFLCEGQQSAEVLGYSPLPINLVQAGQQQVQKIPGGNPVIQGIAACNNPTFSPDGTNRLAAEAPYPPDCDRQGAEECTTGTGGAADTPTAPSKAGPASSGSNGSGGASGSGNQATGGTGGGSQGAGSAGGGGSSSSGKNSTGGSTGSSADGGTSGGSGTGGGSSEAGATVDQQAQAQDDVTMSVGEGDVSSIDGTDSSGAGPQAIVPAEAQAIPVAEVDPAGRAAMAGAAAGVLALAAVPPVLGLRKRRKGRGRGGRALRAGSRGNKGPVGFVSPSPREATPARPGHVQQVRRTSRPLSSRIRKKSRIGV